jgi:hypothetical protein
MISIGGEVYKRRRKTTQCSVENMQTNASVFFKIYYKTWFNLILR